MTGKRTDDSIESLLEDLKTRIKLDLEEKDDPEVYKRTSIDIDRTPTTFQVGYVLPDGASHVTTPRPNQTPYSEPQTLERHRSASPQSNSSLCDSHTCPSCDSVPYDTDSSVPSTRNHTARYIHPAMLKRHHTPPGLREAISPTIKQDRDTASETTSGVSSQDIKLRFTTTSDSETQTDVEVPKAPKNVEFEEQEDPAAEGTRQTIFYLDKYTHLTKRKRNRGIPNVCKWFGMSAIEHLIQNSVNCNSWVWANNEAAGSALHSAASSTTTISRKGSDELLRVSSSPVRLCEVEDWESEKSLLDVLSDIGEQLLDNASPANSRRGSILSLASPLPDRSRKKPKKGTRLSVSGKTGLSGLKNSIITKVRSPCSFRRDNHAKIPKIKIKTPSRSMMNGSVDFQATTTSISNSSTDYPNKQWLSANRKEEEEEEDVETELNKRVSTDKDTLLLNEPMKTAALTELMGEDLNAEDLEEKKKKKKSRSVARRSGGGGSMMKCAMFDEFVEVSKSSPRELVSDSRAKPTKREAGSSPRVEGRLQSRHEDKSISR